MADSQVPEEQVQEGSNVKEVEQVAKEVLAGHWGRGNVRKQRLIDAGWDADAVQREVQRIVKG
jgi:lysozyme